MKFFIFGVVGVMGFWVLSGFQKFGFWVILERVFKTVILRFLKKTLD